MGRAHGLCQLCPPMRRGGHHRTHRDDPVQWCTVCHAQICERHVRWVDGQWLCARCERKGGVSRA